LKIRPKAVTVEARTGASLGHASAGRPRVVIVRPTDVETDSRAKKLALSLDRLGYDTTVLGRSGTGECREGRLGGAHVKLLVPRSRLRGTPRRLVRSPIRRFRRFERLVNRRLQRAERRIDAWLRRIDREGAYLWHAAQRDFHTTYGPEIVLLAPAVIHVHDPRLLPVAFRAAGRIKARDGHECAVVYDSRENFAGIPDANIPLRRYHRALLRHESRLAPRLAAVLTVSQGTANALAGRLRLSQPPVVVLNAPVEGGVPSVENTRSLRADTGTEPGTPLIVYPGAATRPRGVDTMIEALPLLPGVHAALVVVPFPHPRADELTALARSLGVVDRLHLLAPVPADAVPGYLGEADVAVSPILAGPANHEAALPNKLFEMLHSGLPIVTSDIRAMSEFVVENELGVVFRSGDASDLARAVNEVLADPDRWTDRHKRADLVHEWSWQAQEVPLGDAYRRVLPSEATPDTGPFPPVKVAWS
jgi:glycosyltransferase involved in cell wall biosynthesis